MTSIASLAGLEKGWCGGLYIRTGGYMGGEIWAQEEPKKVAESYHGKGWNYWSTWFVIRARWFSCWSKTFNGLRWAISFLLPELYCHSWREGQISCECWLGAFEGAPQMAIRFWKVICSLCVMERSCSRLFLSSACALQFLFTSFDGWIADSGLVRGGGPT